MVVQSFTPCIVRFGPMLCMSGWWQVANIAAMAASLALKVVLQNRDGPPGIHPDYSMHALSLVLHQEHHEEGSTCMSFKRVPLHAMDTPEPAAPREEARRAPQAGRPLPTHTKEPPPPVPRVDAPPDTKKVDDEQDVYDLFRLARQAAMEPARLPV